MWDLRHFPQVDKDKQKAYNTRKKKIVLVERKKKFIFWIRIETTFGGSRLNLLRQLSEFIS